MSVLVLVEKHQQACPFTHGLPREQNGQSHRGPRTVFPSLCNDADKGYGWQGPPCVSSSCVAIGIYSCF